MCALVCDSLSKAECVPTFTRKSERGPFVREVEKRDMKQLWIEFVTATLPDFLPLLTVGVHREPGNVCI